MMNPYRILAYLGFTFAIGASSLHGYLAACAVYVQNDEFIGVLGQHVEDKIGASTMLARGQRELPQLRLAITVFHSRTTGVRLRYFIDMEGRYFNGCEIVGPSLLKAKNWEDAGAYSMRNTHSGTLSSADQRRLLAAIESLPAQRADLEPNDLAIVSFRLDGKWMTRTLRQTDLESIYAVIGERSETKGKTEVQR